MTWGQSHIRPLCQALHLSRPQMVMTRFRPRRCPRQNQIRNRLTAPPRLLRQIRNLPNGGTSERAVCSLAFHVLHTCASSARTLSLDGQ